MQTEEIIKLTYALYSVVANFPQNEPLGKAIKKNSLNILAGCCLVKSEIILTKEQRETAEQKVLKNIIILENYFKLAKMREWVRAENFEVLNKYYNEIKKSFVGNTGNRENQEIVEKAPVLKQKKENLILAKNEAKDIAVNGLKKPRHKKIIQEIQKKKEMQVRDLEQILPNITKRTIRRDMGYLMSLGLIERNGDKSATSYKIKI